MNLKFWKREPEEKVLDETVPSFPECKSWILNLFHRSHVIDVFDDGIVMDEYKYTKQQGIDTLRSISDACLNLANQLEKSNG